MILLIQLVLLLVWICIVHSDIGCPMSSVMDLNNSHSFFYPVDIYAPQDDFKRVVQSNQIFPCFGALLKHARHPHNCSTAVRFCPVHNQNIVDATRRKFGSHSLCDMKKKLSDASQSVRLFVLGGSVPAGSNAQWCNAFDEPGRLYTHKRCSWFYHFGEWMRHSSAANVTHYNLAHGGHSSYVSALSLTNSLKLQHVHGFTSNDIVFLDHSANDDQEQRPSLISREVESLVHRIYSLSSNNSWPSIVIVDGNPMKGHGRGYNVYPLVYENVSRHYNIPMWSYRDAMLSDYTELHQSQYAAFLNFSLNDWTQHAHDIHPPWHVHLFMADLYSAIFRSELDQCTEVQVEAAEKLHNSHLVMPPPLSVDKLIMECRSDVPDFLSISYDEVQQGVAIGSYSGLSADGWHLGEDGHGRGGFIAERHAESDPKAVNVLSLRLQNTTKELMTRFHDVFVQIMYLRTYANAGQVQVKMCGADKGGLDALWEDYETHRTSVPEWKEIRLVFPDCLDNNFTHPTIEFVHQFRGNDREFKTVRGHYKFKVVSVKVCAENG